MRVRYLCSHDSGYRRSADRPPLDPVMVGILGLALLHFSACVSSRLGTLDVQAWGSWGGPVSCAFIQVLSTDGKLLRWGQTDDEGMVQFTLPAESYLVNGATTDFCGPEHVRVHSTRATRVTLLVRICGNVDGFIVPDCTATPCPTPFGFGCTECEPCPGRPEIPTAYGCPELEGTPKEQQVTPTPRHPSGR